MTAPYLPTRYGIRDTGCGTAAPRNPHRASRIAYLASLLVLVAAGCGESEQISRYAVPKPAETPVASRDSDNVASLATQPASAWFLKLTGPADAVADVKDEFRQFVTSTTINGGEPEWTLPEGWSRQSGSGMRYATLTIDKADPPLEVSVTRLTYPGGRAKYLNANIDRWRGEVGLPPASGDEGAVESLEESDQDTTLVDLTGSTEDYPEARMLAAILLPTAADPSSAPAMKSPPMQPPVASTPPPQAEDGPLTYKVPEGWEPGKRSMMRVAAFQVSDGEEQVEITVIPAGGDVLSNVNRWRVQQLGLDAWTDEELKQASEELTIDGRKATYVNLAGADQTILAAILPGQPQSWFFKLRGDPDLAEREAERFKAFVESVRIK